jgi:hypothetical protein
VTTIQRIRCDWTGFVGSPGISTFYATSAATLVPQIRTMFNAITGFLNTDVHIQVENAGDELDATTGALVGAWSTSAVGSVTGTATGGYSAVSGALMQWGTPVVLGGRRLKGHTFLVPLATGGYDTSGQILSTTVSGITTAQMALVTAASGNFLLWQRPRTASPSWTDRTGRVHPAITARGGGYGAVDTASCRAVVTELRSRRD